MKNKLLSTFLLNLFLTVMLLSAFASKASALQLDGAQTCYTVDLYQTDWLGRLIPDPTTPSGYAYNEIDLTINNTPTIPNGYALPLLLSDPSGCSWSFDNVQWSLVLTSGSDVVTFNGSQVNDFFVNTPKSYHSIIIAYNIVSAGTVTMRVCGGQPKDANFTAYTTTITIRDNSPKHKN